MSEVVLVTEIRHVKGGYIVHVRWPFGPEVSRCGAVVCRTLDEVIDLLRKADKGIDP